MAQQRGAGPSLYIRGVKPVTVERMRFLSAVSGHTMGETLDTLTEMWMFMRKTRANAKVLAKFGLDGDPR